MKGNIDMILSKLYEGTIRGLRFFIVQLFVLTAIEEFLSLFGGGRGFSYLMLFMSLQICILAYTMIFSLFYSFASFKQDIKSAFYPYMLYAGLVYLGIVSSNDWNFGRVTIDSYMLMGWLAPIYGLGVLILKEFIKIKLRPYPRLLKAIRVALNVFSILFVLVFVFYIVAINFL